MPPNATTDLLSRTIRLNIVSLALGLGACGGGDTSVAPPVATSIAPNSSTSLTAVAGAAVTALPSVIVKDQRGDAMAGVPVTFTVIFGGGTITGSDVLTNASGVATAGAWTLGTVAGSNSLTASTSGLTPVTFNATGTAGVAASAVKTAGDAQGATAGSAVSTAPTVTVKDTNGNPVSGVLVVFTVASGGGSVTGGMQTTNIAGVATVGGWTLGATAGGNSLMATATGLEGSPMTFTATGSAGALHHFAVTAIDSGAIPSQLAGAAFDVKITAQDANNNTVTTYAGTPTLTSTGTLSTGGGTTEVFTAGVLSSKSVTISNSGIFTLTASDGAATGVSSSFPVNPGAVATVMVSPSSASVIASQSQQLTALLKDASGNIVNGGTVAWNSSNTSVAIVSASGLVTAVGGGMATLTATSNGKTGAATITVLAFTALTTGQYHTCGLISTGAAYCWGENSYGKLGDASTSGSQIPVPVYGGFIFTALTSGNYQNCGLTSAGAAYCWGRNDSGELGDGTTNHRVTPVAVQGGLAFATLTAGSAHSCGLTTGHAAYCWGGNNFGQLGDGTQIPRLTPVAVQGGLLFASLTTMENYHTCGLTNAGEAYCWGHNGYGELGDGTTTQRLTPSAVQGGIVFAALAAGSLHTCGLTNAGAAYCWGYNVEGELGDGTTTGRVVPVRVQGGLVFAALTAGYNQTCGLTSAGAAYCWGYNGHGELGNGNTINRLTPAAVQGNLVFTALTAGVGHTCGVTSSGAAYCWGYNASGQLGDGTAIDRLTPVAVIPP